MTQARKIFRGWRHILATLVASTTLSLASPATAVPMPDPGSIATASEMEILAELRAFLAAHPTPEDVDIAPLNDMLARLDAPTPLRGFVQVLRATLLSDGGRLSEASEAAEEAVRLLPGYSAPLLTAAQANAYAGHPGSAADYFLRASRIDPQIVSRIPDYELFNVVVRLREAGDRSRLFVLAERMFEIGWRGADLDLRSSLARAAIDGRLLSGDVTKARALLPNLIDPNDAYYLLTQNEYQPIWDDIERWAGPRQRNLWRLYLNENRELWEASRDPEAGLRYARALRSAGHDATLIREIWPLVEQADSSRDYSMIWAVPVVGDALARQGRWAEADGIFSQASQIWPLGSEANALNITANHQRIRLVRGDAAEALRGIDAAIADSNGRDGEVTPFALAAMHRVRACALHQLGRDADSSASIGFVMQFGALDTRINLLLCLDRADEARAILRGAIENEGTRRDALDFLQPRAHREPPSDFGRMIDTYLDALRNDPELRGLAQRHGRILDYPSNAGAPAEARVPSTGAIPTV